jgi:hypothetical protein
MTSTAVAATEARQVTFPDRADANVTRVRYMHELLDIALGPCPKA